MTRLHVRVYRALLRLHPRAFRKRYGEEMVAAFARLVERAGRSGRWAALAACTQGYTDLLRGAVSRRAGRRPGGTIRGDTTRPRRREGMMGWWRDVRYALRGMWRSPVFTLVASGSLAVGIGAVTAVLSVTNALLLEPMPGISNFDRVVELGRTRDGSGFDTFAYPDFADLRREVPGLDEAAAYAFQDLSMASESGPDRVVGLLVSTSYFDVLGIQPALGGLFGPDQAVGSAGERVAVLSHGLWTRGFGADPDVVGATIRLNRNPYRIIGVAPPDFRGHMLHFEPDVFLPISQASSLDRSEDSFFSRAASWHMALGLRAEGVSLSELNQQLADVGTRLGQAFPETNGRRGFRAVPLGPVPGAGRGAVGIFLTALLGLVVVVLLVTCVNVAGMFLARGVSRGGEVAVRMAIGAGRGALMRQLTLEGLLVFGLGGSAGIAAGMWILGLIRPDLLPLPVSIPLAVEPDVTVAMLTAGLTLAAGIVFGVLPALRVTAGIDLVTSMKEGARGSGGRGIGRLRRALVAGQVGLSLVLLVSAGLFVRSLQRVAAVDTGFEPAGVHLTFLDLSLDGYDDARGADFHARLLASLRNRPGVEHAALATDLPLDLGASGTAVFPEGWDPSDEGAVLPVDYAHVSDGYFESLAIPVRAGRTFRPADREGADPVAVVSESFARRAWEGESALGRSVQFGRSGEGGRSFRIVGVVADVKNQFITDVPRPFVYVPLAQAYISDVHVLMRSGATGGEARQALDETLATLDPAVSRGPVLPLAEYTALGIIPQKVAAGLASGLAGMALLLSGLGLYGVVSYTVGAQRREIGIRMALGEHPSAVLRRFLTRGLRLALPGLAVGGLLSLGVGPLLESLLLELSPYDPITLVAVGAVLLGVVVAATWMPARRAARVDPVDSLRAE